MPEPSDVSVVVVSFNTKDKLRRCLAAIEPEHEIIVVDNASADGSAEMVAEEFPAATLIRNPKNLGFGAANNLGMSQASSKFTLFLNSDAYASPGAIAQLSREFEDPGVVAAGGRLLNPDGSLQQSSANRLTLWAVFCEQFYLEKLFPRSALFSPYWNSWRHETSADVEQVMGACLMIPSEKLKFDERFFLYVEDTDLCRRLRALGRIRYVPQATFVHELGSSSQVKWQGIARYNRGKVLYFRIHHGLGASTLCWILNKSGALLRLAAWSLATLLTLGRPRPRARIKAFLRVLFDRGQDL